jgi:UDP-N-acetyl-D-glucosamine dehydrogenase
MEELADRIRARQAKVGIIGLGYVGLPLALLFNQERFPVVGFDIDAKKVETLTRGGSYIVRIPAAEIQDACAQGFSATSDYARISEMDAIIIAVPTPLDEYREPDLSYIVKTAEAIAPNLRANQLVVLESTTYPGTTEYVLVPILEKHNNHALKAHRAGGAEENMFFVAFSPEREDPGRTDTARSDIPKVIGGLSPEASTLAAALYGSMRCFLPSCHEVMIIFSSASLSHHILSAATQNLSLIYFLWSVAFFKDSSVNRFSNSSRKGDLIIYEPSSSEVL